MVRWWSFGRKEAVGPSWYRNGRIGTRVRHRGVIAARVRGRRAVYEVFGSPLALDCTCSARQLPCPHVLAVGAEWAEAPSGFAEVAELAPGLPAGAEEALERLLLIQPARLLDAVERGELPVLAQGFAAGASATG